MAQMVRAFLRVVEQESSKVFQGPGSIFVCFSLFGFFFVILRGFALGGLGSNFL